MSTATFTDMEAMAQFCAAMLREGMLFEVIETQAAGRYEVRCWSGK